MNRTEIQIMLDTETMGTKPGSAVVSIGAVRFIIDKGIIDRFYTAINLTNSKRLGMTTDPSTVTWWKSQSAEAIAAWATSETTVDEVTNLFTKWVGNHKGPLWSQGLDFDMTMMRGVYWAVGKEAPWNYWQQMDSRTLFTLADIKTKDMVRVGEFHNALGDAETQATYLIKLLDQMVE